MTKKKLLHPDGYHPVRKLRVVWNGFWYVIKYDFSVTYKVLIAIPVLVFGLILNEFTEFMLLLIATGYMISMEMINSCIELLCDYHSKEYDEKIKVIKDVAATAAGISILIWVVVLGYDIYEFLN